VPSRGGDAAQPVREVVADSGRRVVGERDAGADRSDPVMVVCDVDESRIGPAVVLEAGDVVGDLDQTD